jgi:hypothetical protein
LERDLGLPLLGLKTVNADQTMRWLKYRNPQLVNSDYPHVGNVTEKRFRIWTKNYLGLILSTTGRNYNTIERLNKILKMTYYNTFMVFVDIDEETGRNNIKMRPIFPAYPENKNRIVDMEFFDEAYSSVKANLPKYQNLFESNFAIVKNVNGTKFDPVDFENARKKINKFLSLPASEEATAILKGVKNKNIMKWGRRYTRI